MNTVAISGANRGIGLALAGDIAARGDRVVALCRKPSARLTALGAIVIDGVDVAGPHTLDGLADRLRESGVDAVDMLINNAGVLSRQTLGAIDEQAIAGIQTQFAVNSLGPLLLTQALLPLLRSGSKVGIVTSRMGSIADNTSGSSYGYRMSKAAVNMAGASLAVDLRDRGIAVALLHPGYVRTEMTGGQGLIDAPEAAEGLLRVMDALTIEESGGFWHSNGERLPW